MSTHRNVVKKVKTCDEPFEDSKGSRMTVRSVGDGGKDVGVFAPVGREFCEGDGGEDEGGRGEGREVARERGDAGGGKSGDVKDMVVDDLRFEKGGPGTALGSWNGLRGIRSGGAGDGRRAGLTSPTVSAIVCVVK